MTAAETRVDDDTATDSHPRWWRRPLSPRSITVMALAMIVLAAGIRSYWIFNSWFLTDDFLFTGDIARGVDDLGWYLRIHQGHFMPVSFGLVKLVAVLSAPFSWAAAAAEILVLQVLVFVSCWWMLRTVFGNRPAILAGLAFYLFSPLTMPAIMWWAVAINQLPHQIAFFGAIASHVSYCRSRQRRWLVSATLFLSLGYLSYAKTGLIVIVLAIVTLVWFSFGPPWSRFTIAIKRYGAAWAVYGVVSVAWLITYLHQAPADSQPRPVGFLELVQTMMWETFIPALTGGPWRWYLFGQGPISYTEPPLLPVILGAAAVLAVVLYSWGTRTRSLQILWAVGAYLLVSALLVFSGRAYILTVIGGGAVGHHLQYVSDIAPLISLTVVALFVPVVDAFDPITIRREPPVRYRPSRSLLAVGAIAIVAGGLYSSNLYAQEWRSYPERVLAQRSVAEIKSQEPEFADVGVATSLLPPLFGERSLIKNYFAPLGDDVRVSTAGTDLSVFDDDARIVPAGVRDPGSTELVADPVPKGDCLDVSEVGRWYTVVPPPSLGLWLEIEYRASASDLIGSPARSRWAPPGIGTMSVAIGDRSIALPASSGEHRVLISTPKVHPTVHLTAGPDLDLCVSSIRYGLVAPVTGGAA